MSTIAKIEKWERLFASTLEQEAFGQVIEAAEGYTTLVSQLRTELKEKGQILTGEQRTAVIKLQQCFSARMNILKNPLLKEGISLDKMKLLKKDFAKLFTGMKFPVDTSNLPVLEIPQAEVEEEEAPFVAETKGKLLPCPSKLRSGDIILKIQILNIGLKDATTYLEPFITVSVRDPQGKEIEPPQDTPHATSRKERMVCFDASVFMQTPLNHLSDDAAIFFEFKHWKPKKQKISTRCWSLLTFQEIKEGPIALEIYAKPTDYFRRSFAKHSVKDLFFHVKLSYIHG